MRILYVEDDPASQKLLAKRLTPLGAEVVVAENGQRAMELLRSESFDALVLDIMMPGIDGFQVGRFARREGMSRSAPIVFLTAHPYALRDAEAKVLQPAASLTKPVQMDKLFAALGLSDKKPDRSTDS